MKKYLRQSEKAPDVNLNQIVRDIKHRSEMGTYPELSYGFNQYTSQLNATSKCGSMESSKMNTFSTARALKASKNIQNQVNRDTKYLETYDKNQ
jgi:hypothetical protein